jgi:uncharacterized membrane protein YdbT with pleckstrin-like domain
MKKQYIGSCSRPLAGEKTAEGLLKQAPEEMADVNLDRSLMRRMVLSALMACLAIAVCIILFILRLSAFWHYFLQVILFAFTILAFVEVYLLGKEIREH